MRQDDFERRRLVLEEQLEKDLELVREAHRIKLRALEELRSAAAGEEPSRPSSEPQNEKPVPAGPVVRKPPRHLIEALEDAWYQIPAEFNKHDLYGILGYQPPRATLDRAINELLLSERIVVHQGSGGWHRTKYRKILHDPV
jgi:hypothetical protein